ncbi:MAG TPA: DUF5671 domain-containing protein [Candidatus Baltobacteraceae bacterium]|jgi:hypothetical protein
MTDDRLSDFVTAAKAKGVDDASLVALLRQQGWQEQRVYRALTAYYQQSLGIDVPSRGSRAEDARDAFFHLIAFITLGAWVVALINLGDALVDRALPSPGQYSTGASGLSWWIATIIIAFPICLWVNVLIGREAKLRPESLQSGVRKWLTYVALVVASVVLLGDGIWFLGAFLTGEVTAAFAVRSALLIGVTGGVFAYYLGSVRATVLDTARDRIFAGLAIAAVAVALVLGFIPLGSPSDRQAIARDDVKLQALYALAGEASADRNAAGAQGLPATISGDSARRYQRIDANAYRLCETFEHASPADTDNANAGGADMWKHPAGYHCFTIDARQSPTAVPYPGY